MHARVVLLLLLSFPLLSAQECQNVLESLRDFTSPALSEYPELAQVRSDTMLLIYSQGGCSEKLQEFAAAGLEFLRKMDAAYAELSSSPREAIRTAASASEELERLEKLAPGAGVLAPGIAADARSGWRRFLEDVGEAHYRRAGEAGSTSEEISELEVALSAYTAADSPRAVMVEERLRRLREAYTEDMRAAGAALERGREYLREAEGRMRTPAGALEAYPVARDALRELRVAEYYYRLHGERVAGEAAGLRARAEELVSESRRGILKLFGVLVLLLAPLAAYLQGVIGAWGRDGDECRLGAELMGT